MMLRTSFYCVGTWNVCDCVCWSYTVFSWFCGLGSVDVFCCFGPVRWRSMEEISCFCCFVLNLLLFRFCEKKKARVAKRACRRIVWIQSDGILKTGWEAGISHSRGKVCSYYYRREDTNSYKVLKQSFMVIVEFVLGMRYWKRGTCILHQLVFRAQRTKSWQPP